MMLSQKRSHAIFSSSTMTKSDASAVGAKLTDSLSISLHELLSDHSESSSKSNETESHHQDIYHQYLNSPPPTNVTNPSHYDPEKAWKERAEEWLSSAMATMGVGSNVNAIKFRRENGMDNDESFADGRYMVWFVKEILLGLAIEGVVPNREGLDGHDTHSPDYEDDYFRNHMIGVLDDWHQSTLELLSKRGTKIDGHDIAEEEEFYCAAGVMWQLLLQNASLSPDSLRDCLDDYSNSQDRYEESSLSLYFGWPSFFRLASAKAAGGNSQEQDGCMIHSSKRRKNKHSEGLFVGGEPKSIAWLPLFGYVVAYSFLSWPISTLNTDEKIRFLKGEICDSLPAVMGMGNFDYNTKNSLLSGVLACVVDELGDWIVLDGLELGDDDSLRGDGMHEELCARASVSDIVDLLLVDAGILAKLATLTRTPLANLVAEIADAIMNYSVVYNRLRLPLKINTDQDNESDKSFLQQQNHVVCDAQHVVDFMEKANPQLKDQLINRKFVPGQYFSSTGSLSAPPHPVVIYTRALIALNKLPEVSKLCRILEDSSGIDDSSKRHCYYLLFENMHDNGVLFEDGWNDNAGGATLANITVDALGRKCALDYLENLVLQAKENLLSNLTHSHHHKKQAKHELLCIKDAVRRTVLKFLLPRRYSTHEALTIATSLSDAMNIPQLENVVWGANDSNLIAHKILSARSMYSAWNEYILGKDEDSIFEKNEALTRMKNMDAEGSSQAKKTTAETIHNELAHKNYQKCGHDDPTHKKDEETCNDVINLEHSESSSASGTESIEDNEDENEELDVSYPRHNRQFTGNYSESDDYEVDDEEEAERHLAFKGEDDDTSEDDAIEILSSQDEDDDEEDEDEEGGDEEEEEGEENNEEEEDEDGEEYDASSGGEESENNIDETAEKFISKSENAKIELEGCRESDEDMFIDGGMLRAAVHQFVIPSTAEKKTSAVSFQTMDDQVRGNENKGGIKEQMGRHNEGRLVQEDEEVAEGQLQVNEYDAFEDNETSSDDDTTETDGIIMADDEQSIDTEEDKRIYAETSIDTEDEKRDDQVESKDEEMNDGVESRTSLFGELLTQHESEVDHGKPSVLVVAAMSSQRQGCNQIDSHSKYAGYELPRARDSHSIDDTSALQTSMDTNRWENYGNTSQDCITDIEKSCSMQVDTRYLDNAHINSDDNGDDSSTKLAEESGHTDDGYVPDAEVTEEEWAARAQNEVARTIRFLDGYIPDTELTEEERPKKILKSGEGMVAALRVTENTSIDQGYEPDDTLTEEERGETISTSAQNVDAGYFPDGSTTLLEAEVGNDNSFNYAASSDDCIPSIQKASGDDGRASVLRSDSQEYDREDAIMLSDRVAVPTILKQDQSELEAQEALRLHDTDEIAGDESFSVNSGEIKISDLPFIVDERAYRNDGVGQNTSMSEIECAVTTSKDTGNSESGDADVEPGVDTDEIEVKAEPCNLEQATNAEKNVTIDKNAQTTQLSTGDSLSHSNEISKLKNVTESVTEEDISKWLVKQLREKLYELNVPIRKGWLKKDLVKCVQNHFNNRPILEGAPLESKAASNSSKQQDDASSSISSTPKPETPSSSVRRSARDKTSSLKAALIQVARDTTPISEHSKPAHSELDDSLNERHSTSSTGGSGPSPGVPTTIMTRRLRGNKCPSLPVVPEGGIVEGATSDAASAVETAAEAELKSSRATRKSAPSKKTASLKRKDNESASDEPSTTAQTRTKSSVIDNSNPTNAPKLEEKQVPPKGASGKSRTKVDDGNASVSTRRSTRSSTSKVSMGTRSSSRRGKK